MVQAVVPFGALKSASFRVLALCPLLIGVALAKEAPKMKTTVPEAPGKSLSMYADEPPMRRAVKKARAELSDFLEMAERPKSYQKDIKVRVALLERNEGEYIWISNFSQDDNSASVQVQSGAYTECALMTLAPKDVAAQYRKQRKPDCEF